MDGRGTPTPGGHRRPRAEKTADPLPRRCPPPVPAADLQDGPPHVPGHLQDPRLAPVAVVDPSDVSAGTAMERDPAGDAKSSPTDSPPDGEEQAKRRAAGPSHDPASGDDIRLAPGAVGDYSDVSALTAMERSYNIIKIFISEFLSIPLRKSEPAFERFPSTGLEKGFLNFYANAPMNVSFSSNEKEPSKQQTFSEWLMKKIDPDDVYMKHFVKMIFELDGISMNEVTSAGPITAPWLYPTMRSFVNSMKAIQKQVPKVQNSASNIEITSAEGVKVLSEVRDTMSRIENLVKDATKFVENSGKQGATKEETESVARTFVEKMKLMDEHDLSAALKQVDKLSQLADIPFSIKKRLDEMNAQMKLLKAMITGMTGAWGLHAVKPDSGTVKPDNGKPDPGTVKPDNGKPDSGTVKPAFIVPVLPFHKVGKVAEDILNKNYLGEVAHRSEVSCLFRKELNPSIAVKVSSAPDVCAVLRHQELWGVSKVRGDVRLVLPFKNRLDEAGAVVPVKQTCVAKLMYLNERACLSATVGLHKDPLVSLGGMLGGSASFFGTTSFCGGGRLTMRSADGSVAGLDAALSLSNPEWWGTASATATLLEGNRGLKVLYNQKVLQKSTIAAQLEYNYQDGSVVACAGVEHKYDKAVLLKAMVKTNGVAQALVDTQEGIAGSRVCASVSVNLRRLDQPPQVGFSISINPTWG